MSKARIAVIGAGLGGATAAALLERSGYDVVLYSVLGKLAKLEESCTELRVFPVVIVVEDGEDKVVCQIVDQHKLRLIPRRVCPMTKGEVIHTL